MKILKYIAFIVMISLGGNLSAGEIDWNNKNLDWLDYDSGLKQLKDKNHVGIIVLYANWCSTCKEYSKIFKKRKVISSLKEVTIIKANVETEDKVVFLKEYDQKYVPKTIVIDANGNIVEGIFGEKEDYMFFLPSGDPDAFLQLVNIVKEINSGA